MSSRLELQTILGSSTNKISQVAYAQDCLLYVAGSNIVFYNPIVDEQISFLQHSSPEITSISISNCEQFLAVSSVDRLPGHFPNKFQNLPNNVSSCDVINDSEYSTQSKNKKSLSTITLYKLGQIGIQQPQIVQQLKGHKYTIDHILYSPDGKYLVSVSNHDGSMFVWNCTSGERISQNKNSRKINCIKFMMRNNQGPGIYDLVTSGRGFCKIWAFVDSHTKKLARVYEQQHWMLVGRTVPLSRKLATKQFVDVTFWRTYIILLTHDGLLCLIAAASPKNEKLQKCIDLMIEKTTSMDLYRDKLMCGGHNSLVKVIDLDTLSLVSRLPKPPPLNKQNISKDCDDDEAIICYDQSEDFPQCVGVKTIGTKFNQFIITLYENLTMFIWRPQPTIAAMRSIITHHSSIKLIKILDEISNELTFFGTLSSDSTVRIWHIYKKWIQNRQSIDIASLIGIKRNAYCRNLTRILYLQAEKQVTHMAAAGSLNSKSIACIAQRQFLIYSLDDFEVIGHEIFDDIAVALQIKDQTAYIGFQNGKVGVFQLLINAKNQNKNLTENKNISLDFQIEQQENNCTVNKIRQIQIQMKIKSMKIVEKSPNQTLLLILTAETHELIIYSLQKSSIIHVQKNVFTCYWDNSHIVMCKTTDNMKILYTYSIKKGKTSKLLSLSHQLDEQSQYIMHIRCNGSLIVILTSRNKIIVCNFAPTIVCVKEEISEPINDLQLSDNGEILIVGEYGNIRVYRLKGQNEEMEGQMKKMIEKNDFSWLDNSVWAKKRSSVQGDKSISGNRLLLGSVESVRLAGSGHKAALSQIHKNYHQQNNGKKEGKKVLSALEEGCDNYQQYGMNDDKKLPNVEIKYKSQRNDESIFNPGKIGEQMKGLLANLHSSKNKNQPQHKVRPNFSHDQMVGNGNPSFEQNSLEQINLAANEKKTNIQTQQSKNHSFDQGVSSHSQATNKQQNSRFPKKRIFGSVSGVNSKKQGRQQQQSVNYNKYNNNLVDSVVHSFQYNIKQEEKQDQQNEKKEAFGDFKEGKNPSDHLQAPHLSKPYENISLDKSELENGVEFHNLTQLQLLLGSKKFVEQNFAKLKEIHQKMNKIFLEQTQQMVPKKHVEAEIDLLTQQFKKRLVNKSI